MTSRENWNHVYSFSNSNIRTFSQCISLEEPGNPTKPRITIANLNTEEGTTNLLTYNDNKIIAQLKIRELVSGVLHFQIGPDDSSYPALAVSAGSQIFIYKNLRPFFCYNLPDSAPNDQEAQIWESMDDRDIANSTEKLKKLSENGVRLTSRSQIFLSCNSAEKRQFLEIQTLSIPLRYQSPICCLSSIKKKNINRDEVDHLIVGTEDCSVKIVDTTSFKIIREIKVEDTPVWVSSHGSLNMLSKIFVSTRFSRVYSVETNNFRVTEFLSLSVPIVGLFSTADGLVVASQDRLIQLLDKNAEKIWTQQMPAEFVSFRGIHDYSDWKIVVSLRNKQIFLFNKRNLCSVLNMDYQVQAVTFGQYSTFKNCVIGVTQGGGLEIFSTHDRTLQNSVTYNPYRDGKPKTTAKLSTISKSGLPELQRREAEHHTKIHKVFNYDYTFMRLKIVKELAAASSQNLLPVTEYENMKAKVEWQFDGIGPAFVLRLEVKNVGVGTELTDLFVVLECDQSSYELETHVLNIPMVVPGMSHKANVDILCMEDAGFCGIVKLRLIHRRNQNPLMMFDLEVPANEPFDV